MQTGPWGPRPPPRKPGKPDLPEFEEYLGTARERLKTWFSDWRALVIVVIAVVVLWALSGFFRVQAGLP